MIDTSGLKGKIGTAVRYGYTEQAVEARQDLAAANVANAIEKHIGALPALSPERALHLCELIQGHVKPTADALTA